MNITKKIKADWGTVRHFCIKNNVPYNSLITISGGKFKSQACVDALIEHGYINKPSDLPQYKGN